MKKIIFALVCVLTTTAVLSQVKVRPGINLGANFANLSNTYNSNVKMGLNAGLFVNVHLTSFYELQVETSYSNQGTKYKFSDSNIFDPDVISRDNQNLNLEYVSLNIANKFFPVKNTGFNIIVGPAIDILVSKNNFSATTPIDLSIFGGVGYEFPYGLSVNVRYKQGFIDIRDSYKNYDDNYYDDSVLSGVIQLGVSYKFNY